MPESGKRYSDVNEYLREIEASDEQVGIEGFLKQGDQAGKVLFAPLGDCKSWTEVSTNIIGGLEHLGTRLCFDPDRGAHEHPYVRLMIDPSRQDAALSISHVLKAYTRILANRSSHAARQLTTPRNMALHQAGTGAARRLQYFGRAAVPDNCGAGYSCHGGISQCAHGCACIDADGYGYCSSCCISSL